MASPDLDIRRGPPLRLPREERAHSLVELVWRTVEAHGAHEALRWKEDDAWLGCSYAELGERILRASLGLASLGVHRGTRVAIVSGSRPEWLIADLASLALGAVTCPIHPAESDDGVAFMLRNVDAEVVLLESRRLRARLQTVVDSVDSVRSVVLLEEADGAGLPVPTLGSLAPTDVDDASRRAWRQGWADIAPDDVATIVHTSGSTGQPKGVVLSHGNIIHNCYAALEAIPFTTDDVALTILPLSHMFARAAGMFAPLAIGVTVAFAEPVMERWASNLVEVRPTVMLTVPPFFQRIHRRVMADVARRPMLLQRLFGWAIGLGTRRYANHLAHRGDGLLLRFELWLAGWLVFAPIRAQTGGRLRFFASGGAHLPPEVGEFFYAMGMQILEGYGLSETAPFLTLNSPETFRFGTVGHPFAETEIAIDRATGEILARGPQVMRGYLHLPEETARVIDSEGWFHTGDIGEFDPEGLLLITDRIKNLIVLGNGKKVTPAPMERALEVSPYIIQAVIVGEGRERTGVLVTPDAAEVRAWASTRGVDLPAGDLAALAASPEVAELVEGEVRRLLAGFPAWERPRRVALLPRLLSEKDGELTSLGKPKRGAVLDHWPNEIARLFPPRSDAVPA
jgi:long-chain acyl-CoA synthetase